MTSIYNDSNFVNNKRDKSIRAFNSWTRNNSIDKILQRDFDGDTQAMLKAAQNPDADFFLRDCDIKHLQEVEREQFEQERHNKAFLRGFQAGGR